MTHYDVFNGDADGLCSRQQLRLDAPRDAILVSGTKRDVTLLERVDARRGDSMTVLDISLDANRDALTLLLERGVRVEYFDHHHAGRLPEHPGLTAHIDTSPGACTSLLVDRHLDGRQRRWTVVGAFGDNLGDAARELARSLHLTEQEIDSLRELGRTLNYNAYGEHVSDLVVHPVALARQLARHADPLDCMAAEPALAAIARSREEDIAQAAQVKAAYTLRGATIHVLPDAAWSRRVRGEFANLLADEAPDRAHAVLSPDDASGYAVSIRTPARSAVQAHELCRRFPSGGGRATAAGINHLPREVLPAFVRELDLAFPGRRAG